MDKAIEIKRRAQRCVQNGDLDGALSEYEALVALEDTDPYHYVLLADVLYKKGDHAAAASRYLSAAEAYERTGVYRNGIAVCKKMLRLSLAQGPVLLRLATLHELDGIATEACLYYVQYAETLVREDHLEDAARYFRKAYEVSPDSARPLERLAEVQSLRGEAVEAATALREAAAHYQRSGQLQDADRCRNRAAQLAPEDPAPGEASHVATLAIPEEGAAPGSFEVPDGSRVLDLDAPDAAATPAAAAGEAAGPARLELDHHRSPFVSPVDTASGTGGEEEEQDEVGAAPPSGPPRFSLEAEPDAELAEDFDAAADEAPAANGPPTYEIRDESPAEGADGGAPGLAFGAPGAADDDAPALEAEPEAPAGSEPGGGAGLGRVEQWLARAQEHFRSGDRDAAGHALASAAREYDGIGQHDSAATIYRSLGKSAHASAELLEAWLRNCEVRSDPAEGAQVACDLGDRALNDGDAGAARTWFERALSLDPGSEVASRRLQRLTPGAPPAPAGVAVAAPAPPPAAAGLPEPGRVEVAVGRGEAVTFDLGSLVAEFQRGVEMQISGDPQGHYDLGMAYREMGLLEQAVESFRMAAGDPGFVRRCAEMIGRCMLDQGRFDEAIHELRGALSAQGHGDAHTTDLRFQLGLALEAAGQPGEALDQFEQVYAAQSNYPDVALKIRELRRGLESRGG